MASVAVRRFGHKDDSGDLNATKIRELYEESSRSIKLEQRNYWTNRCFIGDEQNITWDDHRNRPNTLRMGHPNKTRLTENRLAPATRRLMAKLLRRPLSFEVVQEAADDAHAVGSRKAEAALAHVHREQDWEGVRREHALATWIGGTGALGVEWDASSGDYVEDGVGTGDVCLYPLAVSEIATEVGCRNVERGRWWIRAAALPPKEVQELYGLAEEPSADASSALSPLQMQLITADVDGTPSAALTLVLTYYERPFGKGKGCIRVVVDDEVVSSGPWPFPFTDRLNLAVARETVVLGRWTGDTILTTAISPQRALNRAVSSIDEHMSKAGNARLMYEEGSVDADDLTDDPADTLPVRPGAMHQPQYVSPPAMPEWWQARPEELRQAIDDILGDHDVSRGDVSPGGPTSGIGINLLVEQDDTPIGGFAKELAECWGRAASMVLDCYADKVGDTRTARTTVGGNTPLAESWKGSDFCGQTTAVVPLDSVSPRSRGASFQMASALKNQFGPDMPLSLFARIADLPGGDDLLEAADKDVAKARRENHAFAAGEISIPAKFDDHSKHIVEHDDGFRKTVAYEQATPEIRQAADLHVQAHATMAAELAAQQVARSAFHPALAAGPHPGSPPGSAGSDVMLPGAGPAPGPMPMAPAGGPADPALTDAAAGNVPPDLTPEARPGSV